MNKYESLTAELELQIAKGLLQAGEKMDSVREMSRRKGLGINTVLRAYEMLEDRGLIATRPQSGFYVIGQRPARGLTAPRQRVAVPNYVDIPGLVSIIFEATRDSEAIPFGAACLTPDLYPCEAINRLTRAAVREQPDLVGRYEITPGTFEYRRQISRLLERWGCFLDPEEIVAAHGTMEALGLALRATCSPGDTVLIESPQYFGILQALQQLQLKVIEIPTHPSEGLDLTTVESSLKKYPVAAGVFIANFSNPMGMLMSDEKKSALVELFLRHQVPIIEDDIYGDLSFRDLRPKPLKAYDKSGTVLTCSSFSKTISPGLRGGWIAPGRYRKRVEALQLSTTMGASAVGQHVIARYLASREHERNLKALRLHCFHQTERFSRVVLSTLPEGTRVSSPSGGFVLWVEMPKQVDSVELFRKALESRISISPGIVFSARGHFRNYIRLNCGLPWSPRVEWGLNRLAELVRQLNR